MSLSKNKSLYASCKNRSVFIRACLFLLFLYTQSFLSVKGSGLRSFEWDRPAGAPDWKELTEHETPSGLFAGKIGTCWIVGGGFLETDTAKHSQSTSYSRSIDYNRSVLGYQPDTGWKILGELSAGIRSATQVQDTDGFFLIGGENSTGLSKEVRKYTISKGRLLETCYPPLPVPLKNAAAILHKGVLYVGFGTSSTDVNRVTFRLDTKLPLSEWEAVHTTDFTFADARCSAVQNNGTADMWYVFGTGTLAYSFVENRWHALSDDSPFRKNRDTDDLSARCVVSTGTHHLFLADKTGNYVFHTITRKWSLYQRFPIRVSMLAAAIHTPKGFCLITDEGINEIIFKTPNTFGFINYLVLSVYLLLMLLIGVYFNRRTKTTDDFFTGGGKIPWWAAGISIFATTLSAITFMAIPAKTYTSNWLYFPMAFSILIIAPVIIRWYLPFFRKQNLASAYEYLEKRFNLLVRLFSSSLFILFMVTRIAIVLYLPSLALSTVTGMDIVLCILLMSVVTVVYATLGGVEAVIWGDVIQGAILIGGAILSVIYIISATGGLHKTLEITAAADKFKVLDFTFDFTQPTFWVIFFGAGLANTLITYSSDQSIVQRYMTTSDEQKAARSIWLNGLISLPILLLFYFIGSALYAYYDSNPHLLPITMQNAEGIYPYFIVNELPAGIAGLLIAAIFAATMSTLSSNINSASTAITCDFIIRLCPGIPEHVRLNTARLSGILVCLAGTGLAVLLSTMSVKSFFDTFNTFIGLLTSGLGGLFIMGIFFPRIQSYAALLGLIMSTALLLWMPRVISVNFMMYGLLGIIFSISISLLLSFIIPEKRKSTDGLCWKYRHRKDRVFA